MTTLTITTRDTPTGPVLTISGDLDHATTPQLRQAVTLLTLDTGHLLVLDLGALDFCDSSGISALLDARNQASGQGADITLAAVPANTARILSIVGLDRVFALYPDTEQATAQHTTPATGPGASPEQRSMSA